MTILSSKRNSRTPPVGLHKRGNSQKKEMTSPQTVSSPEGQSTQVSQETISSEISEVEPPGRSVER